MIQAQHNGYPLRHARQNIIHTFTPQNFRPLVNPIIPPKEARRVLDWQADVARETAAFHSAETAAPSPPMGPLPFAMTSAIAATHSQPASSPQITARKHTSRRGETYPRVTTAGPAGTGTTASSDSQDILPKYASGLPSRSPKLVKQAIITRHYRGPPSESDLSERFQRSPSGDRERRYRIRQRSRGRKDVETQVEAPRRSRGARRSKSRSTIDRDTSDEWHEEKRRYTHYVIPADTVPRRDQRDFVRRPRSDEYRPQRGNSGDDSIRGGRGIDSGATAPRRNISRRRRTRSYSRDRSSSSRNSPRAPPRHEQLRRDIARRASPGPLLRERTPPPSRPRPTSYASHGSSIRRGSSGLGGNGMGISNIRVIPRDVPAETLAWERAMQRSELPIGMPPPVPNSMMRMPNTGRTTTQRLDDLIIDQESQTPPLSPEERMRMHIESPASPPPDMDDEGQRRAFPPYASKGGAMSVRAVRAPKTLAPSDSISSAGGRVSQRRDYSGERERARGARLRERMGDGW